MGRRHGDLRPARHRGRQVGTATERFDLVYPGNRERRKDIPRLGLISLLGPGRRHPGLERGYKKERIQDFSSDHGVRWNRVFIGTGKTYAHRRGNRKPRSGPVIVADVRARPPSYRKPGNGDMPLMPQPASLFPVKSVLSEIRECRKKSAMVPSNRRVYS